LDFRAGVYYTDVMKFTQYFLATRTRPDRVWIRDEWIELTIRHPDAEHI